jgi:hypothetical protein
MLGKPGATHRSSRPLGHLCESETTNFSETPAFGRSVSSSWRPSAGPREDAPASRRDSRPASAILSGLDNADDPIPDPYLSPRASAPPTQANEAPSEYTPRPPPGVPPQPPELEPQASPPLPDPPLYAAPYHPVPGSPYSTWALLVGMLGLICFGAGPILGVSAMILGILGWRQVARAGGMMRGRATAAIGVAAGFLSIVFFIAEVALYLTFMRPPAAAVAGAPPSKDPAQDPSAAVSPSVDDDPASGTGTPTTAPPSTTSTVTTVGNITVVDVALGVSSLPSELRQQHAEATAHGERLMLETTTSACTPCEGVASSLSDPRMQTALDHVRLVRIDRDPFEDDLAELEIPSRPSPGFFLLDSDLRVTDGINGGEWDDDIAVNIAPVLGPFVRGSYSKRRTPYKKLPRPGGTVL